MIKIWKIAALAAGLAVAAETAHAIAINQCARLVRDEAGRETVVNACTACIAVKVERRRPGQNIGTPSTRDFNIPAGSRQPLPFRGPGVTRVTSEGPCPPAMDR
ncbi:MAG: hypothetical protein HQL36_09870 [Alphaproteobacteria bacterium]|nr:hypothetical protein [Alphaproteobacteria bacterium]MBF0249141.1 hypothetical protein [Alphaproteobacteria bacterium]